MKRCQLWVKYWIYHLKCIHSKKNNRGILETLNCHPISNGLFFYYALLNAPTLKPVSTFEKWKPISHFVGKYHFCPKYVSSSCIGETLRSSMAWKAPNISKEFQMKFSTSLFSQILQIMLRSSFMRLVYDNKALLQEQAAQSRFHDCAWSRIPGWLREKVFP